MPRAPRPGDPKALVALVLGAVALGASVVYGVAAIATAGAPPGAVRLGLPRAVLADVRISRVCGPGTSCANCVDCGCDDDEIALGGGGRCPSDNGLNEIGHRYRTSNVDRVLNVWRVSCAGGRPEYASVVCGSVSAY